MQRIQLSNVNLLGKRGPHDVTIEGDRIISVVPAGAATDGCARPDAAIHDLSGKTVMPGLVAGHTHFSYFEVPLDKAAMLEMGYPASYIAVTATRSAGRVLAAGFTSAMGAGGIHDVDMVLNWLIRDGLAIGPRLVPCGRDLVPTGHPIDNRPEWWNAGPGPLGVICDGPDEFRKAVREEVKRGAEVIKLYPEGGHGFPTRSPRLSLAEIRAVVETAELCGIRVRAHAYSRAMILECLKAGVHIIDHADQMDEEIIDLFVEQGTFVLPSLYLLKAGIGVLHGQEICDRHFARAREILPKAIARGVKLVTGDDFGTSIMPHGANALELQCYVKDIGIAAEEVLTWATVNGAELIGAPDLGEIASGKLADLLVLDGDPIADIAVLTDPAKILTVMQAGKIVAERGVVARPW